MLGALLGAVREFGPLLFLQSLEDLHFGVGFRQGLPAQLQLFGDEMPPFVDPADAGQELNAVEAAAGCAVDGDMPLAAEAANFFELSLCSAISFCRCTVRLVSSARTWAKSRWQWSRRFLRYFNSAASEKTKPFTV